ncbi:MAG: Ig-like domain-containing protein, partial [Actinomycetia bacterium]|nr:Ig-like domain-containing protein [Actinomycetes bacterium]
MRISRAMIVGALTAGVKRRIAGVLAFALAVSGLALVLVPQLQQNAEAETPAANPISHQGATPVWTTLTNMEAVWKQPLDDQSFYWATDGSVPPATVGNQGNILWQAYDWSADMSTYKTRPVLAFQRTATGTTFNFDMFSTQFMARIGGTRDNPTAPLTIYFATRYGSTTNGPATCQLNWTPVVRVTSGSKDIQWTCMPDPHAVGGFTPDLANGHVTGGEADQYTGNLYIVSSVGAYIDDQLSTSTGPSTEAQWVFEVWNPQTGAYSLSGSVQPGDWYQGMKTVPQERIKVRANVEGTGNATPQAPCDFALDADGNVYTYSGMGVSATSSGNMSLVRMEPARDAKGNIVDGTAANPWRYYVVTKIKKDPAFPTQYWSDAGLTWGNAFLNGQFFNAANTSTSNRPAGLPAAATAGAAGTTNMVKIDPLSATAKIVWSTQNDELSTGIARDNASAQMAKVIRGTLYHDVNGNGTIDAGEGGLSGQTVGIYNAAGVLLSVQTTDARGGYSFVVSGGPGSVYFVRPAQVKAPLAGGAVWVNAAQTWAAGSVGTGYDSAGGILTNTAQVVCTEGMITSADGAPCSGAKAPTSPDPAIGAAGSTSTTSDWLTYAMVTMNTDQSVATADFGFTVLGSYGDSVAGPSAATDLPGHINQPSAPVWLGEKLGAGQGPATDGHAHDGTDDGVFLKTAFGDVPLSGQVLAATGTYQLVGHVLGPQAADGIVKGWSGTNSGWTPAASWTPANDAGVATGPFRYQTSGTVAGTTPAQFRAQVSTVDITRPTNAGNEYYGGADGGPHWTTPGEIEDYAIAVSDAVWRPAVKTTGGSATFTVDGQKLTGGTGQFTLGAPAGTPAGGTKTITATAPDATWGVADVKVVDTNTGDEAPGVKPSFTVNGTQVSVSWTPALGDDLTVEITFSPVPDPAKSSLRLDADHATAGSAITATATVVDSQGNPLTGQTVSFAAASAPTTTLSAPSCTTGDAGTCQVTITSQQAGLYKDELSASVAVNGAGKPIGGSPATVRFDAAAGDPDHSVLSVSPIGALTVGTGAGNTYTATTLVRDGFGNPSPGQTVSVILTRADGTPVDTGATKLAAATCTTGDDGRCAVTLTSTQAGSFQLHATIPSATGQATDVQGSPAGLVYQADVVSAPTSTLAVDPDT